MHVPIVGDLFYDKICYVGARDRAEERPMFDMLAASIFSRELPIC